ncbi:hypothetical protein [Streptomyces cinereoruber]|uniref:hypothetical protein n=1 Tax=Streptomyces cinereoruber TaxID=67260 RepID=UPI003633F4DA
MTAAAPTLVNPEDLVRLYGEVPCLGTFRLRAVNLSWRGPTVTLDGFAPDPVVDISLHARDGVTVEVASASVRLRATADTAYIARLSAYATTHE